MLIRNVHGQHHIVNSICNWHDSHNQLWLSVIYIVNNCGISLIFAITEVELKYFPGTVDAPLMDHIWQFCWYFFYLFELNIWHFILQKYCFYAILKFYYFTNLIFWNNIYEKNSIRPKGFILKPKAPLPVHVLLFACTIEWKFQDSISIT